VSRSVGAYITPSMCISMVISVGTTRSVGGIIGGLAKRLGTVVTISSGDMREEPSRLSRMDICM